MTGFLTELDDDPAGALGQSSSRADALASAIIAQVGGLRRFAELWQDLVEQSIEQGKLHLVTRALEGVNKLVALTHQQEVQQHVPVEEMTDEELNAHAEEWVIRHIWEDPEIAVLALEGQGYRVQPPDEAFERPAFGKFLEAIQWRRRAAREAAGD